MATTKAVCSARPSHAANVNTDCQVDENFFEATLAVNPKDPRNVVGGVIKITVAAGQPRLVVQPRVSFDKGVTWATYAAHLGPGTVDPAVAFDAAGTAYLAGTSDGNIVLTRSGDGGRTW
ncbi:MAG: exo-alpha-sialidase, partial [Actinobacteria bacterium]|nr:exo-alpha-sialidase [Actinomycetota bacterium]